MKKLLIFLGALAAYGQTVSLSDTLTNAVGGGSFTGRVTVTLNAPGNASPLYYSTTSLTGWQAVYCIGVTGAECTTTTSAGAFAATLYANSTITPAGTSYAARFQPAKGAAWSETWTVEASDTKLYQVRSTTVPTPTVAFQPSQLLLGAGYIPYGASTGYGTSLAPGTNGHVLTLSAGYPSWATPAACATCVVTSGSYANPAWITSLAGSKISGAVANATLSASATALAGNGANCAAGTFPAGVTASGAAETCTALPTTITGTANQITASASTGTVTLSLPTDNIFHGTTILGYGNVGTSFGGTAAYAANTYANNSVVQVINTFPPTNALPTGIDIQVWMDPTSASVANLTAGINNSFWGGTASSPGGYLYGSSSQAQYNGTVGSLGTMVGLNAIAQSVAFGATNAGTVTNAVAVSGMVFNSGGGTITNGFGFHSYGVAVNRATSAITNYYAFYGQTPAVNSSATITNSYGLYLEDQTEATTLNYGIYTGKGINRIGDQLVIVPTVANSTTVFEVFRNNGSTVVFDVDTTNQCIGIGTASCSASGVGGGVFTGSVRASSGLVAVAGNISFETDGSSFVSAAGTLYMKPSVTDTDQYIQVSPSGTATITGFILKGQLSGTTGTRADILQSGADTIIRNQTLGASSQGAITLEQNGSVRLKVFAATGNIAIGTTTDLGYGLHAASKGTNGNLLCADMTETTGTTRCLHMAGQGQSGNIWEIRGYNATPGSGTLFVGVDASGFLTTQFSTPSSSAETCTQGRIKWDANYIYLCTAANTYKRATLAAF